MASSKTPTLPSGFQKAIKGAKASWLVVGVDVHYGRVFLKIREGFTPKDKPNEIIPLRGKGIQIPLELAKPTADAMQAVLADLDLNKLLGLD